MTGKELAVQLALVFSALAAAPCGAQEPPAPEPGGPDDERVFADPETWYDLDAPTSPEYELDEILAPHTAMFDVTLVDRPIDALLDQQRRLEEATGLRVGAAYTHLFQQASGGPGTRWGMAGDLDLILDWTLVGRGTEDTGRLVFSAEERFRAGQITPADLRGEIGSLAATAGGFNDWGLVVRDVFWDQRLFDARLRLLAGRAAAGDYVGSHRLASPNFGFLNSSVAGNPTMAFTGHGPTALASVHPTDTFYATVGGANAYNVTTETSISSLFDEGQIYGFGEVGVTPYLEGLGSGRYAVTGWNMPGRSLDGISSDSGVSVTVEQYVADVFWVFLRYGYADRGITGVRSAWQAAIAIDGLLGSPDNLSAIGIGYAVPTNDDLRDETSIEAFHRFQLTRHAQLTVGAQLILNPGNAPGSDAIGVFPVRLRIDL